MLEVPEKKSSICGALSMDSVLEYYYEHTSKYSTDDESS